MPPRRAPPVKGSASGGNSNHTSVWLEADPTSGAASASNRVPGLVVQDPVFHQSGCRFQHPTVAYVLVPSEKDMEPDLDHDEGRPQPKYRTQRWQLDLLNSSWKLRSIGWERVAGQTPRHTKLAARGHLLTPRPAPAPRPSRDRSSHAVAPCLRRATRGCRSSHH